ncbi:TonB-dependent receptor [Novosphingobium terrae]|uniref:TonB-dependent receptor n=1 Tax=Novosphingobium terrae TaxID=2726189 RepID=UPI001981DE09|nr:TonB-dependent receptor [Novosphingobium terrae]
MKRKSPGGVLALQPLLLAAVVGLVVPAAAHAGDTAHTFDIPAGPAASALQSFARQAGRQVMFPYDAVRDKMAPAMTGRMPDDEVLRRLAAAAGLVVVSDDGHTILLQKASARRSGLPSRPRDAPPRTRPPAEARRGENPEPPLLREAPPTLAPSDILVTGSRVIANGNNSPTPVTVMSTRELQEIQPGSLVVALQNLPVFQGSLGQGTGTGGSTGGPNGASNAVNLRNLGLFRTLVLFDGNRVQPTANTGLVTLDILPQILMSRVDVVTGGVSAVYGSDAISGVVNFITDHHFNGVKLKAQIGVSQLGDDRIVDTGIALGSRLLDGRGHIEASLEYFDDPGIFDTGSRALGQGWAIEGAGTAANPYRLYSGVRVATTSAGGLIRSGPLAGLNFRQNGVLSPFAHGAATATPGFEVGGDGGYYGNTSLKAALRTRRAFARFDLDATDSTHLFLEGFGALNTNRYANQSLSFTNVAISAQNAFLPAAYRYATADTNFALSEIPQNIGPHVSIFDNHAYWLNAGAQGKLGLGWAWQIGGTHGMSQQIWTTLRNINYAKLSAALDAVSDPATGQVVCRVTLTNPGLYPGCAPLNLFGPTAASAQALAYVTDTTRSVATTSLDEASGSLTGTPFSTWAGPVHAAVSGEWRQTRFSAASPISPGDYADCTGLRFNCVAGATRLHQVTFAPVAPVHQAVWELALEGDLPLLKDAPLARALNLNLAARYADYDSFGGAWTWKAGLDWTISEEWRLRATRSRDFRAPNLNDLYAAQTISRTNVVDTLTGATLVNAPSSLAGNAGLKPEVGNTLTGGVVYTPRWLPHASLSVDAYDIRIANAIVTLNGSTATIQNICNASGGTASLCSLVVRPYDYANSTTANNATLFYNIPLNAAWLHTRGLDVEANYAARPLGRPLSLRVMATWQPVLRQTTPGLGADLNLSGYAYSPIAGVGSTPAWRATGVLSVSPADKFRVTLTQRWRSGLKWNADTSLVYAIPDIPSFGWTNLNLSWTPKGVMRESEFYLNIQNLFNAAPPVATNSQANPGVFGAYVSSDDYVGRYITAGVRLTF